MLVSAFQAFSKVIFIFFCPAEQRPARPESRYDSLKSNNGELAKELGMKFVFLWSFLQINLISNESP